MSYDKSRFVELAKMMHEAAQTSALAREDNRYADDAEKMWEDVARAMAAISNEVSDA